MDWELVFHVDMFYCLCYCSLSDIVMNNDYD